MARRFLLCLLCSTSTAHALTPSFAPSARPIELATHAQRFPAAASAAFVQPPRRALFQQTAALRVQTVWCSASPGPDNERLIKLLVSILIDLVGVASYAVPLAGEGADLAWAPVSALLVNYLYGNSILTGLAFAEEVLPGLDVVPTATIGWLLENTELGRSVNEASAPPPKADAPSSAGKSRGHDADVIDVNGR